MLNFSTKTIIEQHFGITNCVRIRQKKTGNHTTFGKCDQCTVSYNISRTIAIKTCHMAQYGGTVSANCWHTRSRRSIASYVTTMKPQTCVTKWHAQTHLTWSKPAHIHRLNLKHYQTQTILWHTMSKHVQTRIILYKLVLHFCRFMFSK